jgi:hypothetical protein
MQKYTGANNCNKSLYVLTKIWVSYYNIVTIVVTPIVTITKI